MSEILRSTKLYTSVFECGILDCDSIADFDYHNHILPCKARWRVDKNDFLYIRKANSFNEMYRRLIEKTPCFKKDTIFFDKTPAYLECL